MKNKKCHQCGYELEYKTEICPNCGAEKPELSGLMLFIYKHKCISVLIAWIILGLLSFITNYL